MFRKSDPQGTIFETSVLMPPEKLERLRKSWVWPFKTLAMPLIDEELFRVLYDEETGRPNKPVKTVVGTLILKEMFDLTDNDALWRLEFDLGWQVALDLEPEEAHCCQKTLHNFRMKLIESGRAQVLFKEMTGKIIEVLGVDTAKQRLDSTHIISNIKILTRLGLFCETLRVFLHELASVFPEQFEKVPERLRQRYLKEDGSASSYEDVPSTEARRRVGVSARDTWRLVDRFKGHQEIEERESYKLLQRLLSEQCEIDPDAGKPAEGDADSDDHHAPVQLKKMKEVASDSLQTPHDPDVTFSGHKGKGYEVQVSETCDNEEKPEILTHVDVTPSCCSDVNATMPVVETLEEQALKPDELTADTLYGSASNFIECAEKGVELITPVPGPKPKPAADGKMDVNDFAIDLECPDTSRCPAGHKATEGLCRDNGKVVLVFGCDQCSGCSMRQQCPTKRGQNGNRVFRPTVNKVITENRRKFEESEEFRRRYAIRAGIEASNSELKRAHGLGRLRVRGGSRVKLAVYLKAIACNVKRMVNYATISMVVPTTA